MRGISFKELIEAVYCEARFQDRQAGDNRIDFHDGWGCVERSWYFDAVIEDERRDVAYLERWARLLGEFEGRTGGG